MTIVESTWRATRTTPNGSATIRLSSPWRDRPFPLFQRYALFRLMSSILLNSVESGNIPPHGWSPVPYATPCPVDSTSTEYLIIRIAPDKASYLSSKDHIRQEY